MPAAFERCVKRGGRVRRIVGPSKRWRLRRGEWLNICIDQRGNVFRGKVHRAKRDA